MSATLAPFGARPVFDPTGQTRATAYTIASGYGTTIYRGTPVALNTNGTITIATVGANDFIGIFAGCEYIDANGKPNESAYWPASTTATNIVAYVYDQPYTVYEIQADGSVAQTAIGDQANFSGTANYTVADGSTATGNSSMALSATLAGAGVQGQFRIVGFNKNPDNAPGDTYTIVQVQIARHQYVAVKVAV